MKNRCLFLIESAQIESEFMKKLCNISENYEEAIFVLKNADQLHEKNLKSGDLLVALQLILKLECIVPFYVLPFASKGAKGLSVWLKLKMLTPAFTTLYSLIKEDELSVKQFLNCRFELLQADSKENTKAIKTPTTPIKRGLYITRAQPLHNGHAAFIEQMATENDEIIVLLSAAEQSHQPNNPLSATERLEMVHEYLHKNYPNRFYLLALPQNAFTLENMYEPPYLLPEYQSVYATNPVITSMCTALNIPVKILDIKMKVSATEIRNRLMANESCSTLMPSSILKYLEEINFQERLHIINHQYKR